MFTLLSISYETFTYSIWRYFCLPSICKSLYGHTLSFLLGSYLGVGRLDLVVILFNFFKMAELFSSCCTLWHSPPAVHKSSTSLSTVGVVSLFNFSHSSKCVQVSHCAFNLHFLKDECVEHIFICISLVSDLVYSLDCLFSYWTLRVFPVF